MDTDSPTPRYEAYEAAVVSDHGGSTECTIFPRDADDDRRTTAWITAREEAYCSAASMR
ncbi:MULTISPECIES: DUF7511 domain-containing protein [Halorubrum]|uniref:DUF7511 domain-containing protein n=1 Tax=Halorubrum sodomense TaxID=35743 RepID=A0A1I6H4W1_HALSD|nr:MULTISPECIES: hypothetical protein [Halorubrum]SFR49468.1 hypothetical protein SAMN04487937_2449 [Halorubrum sodomense]